MITKKTQLILLAVLILVIAGEGYLYFKQNKYWKEEVPAAVDVRTIDNNSLVSNEMTAVHNGQADMEEGPDLNAGADLNDNARSVEPNDKPAPPDELNLKAVFYSQAPFADWDYPWQEACEEASVLLVANEYFGHNWSREEFKNQILELVDWEIDQFGDYEHTSVDQTAKILEDYLGLETVIHEDPGLDDVKEVLADGHFIIMTFAGKELGNPFFRNGGPVYHAVLVKGYKKDDKIITHDVGTKNGEDYVYSWSVIENALHDYAEPIEDGAKRMIEVLPPDDL